MQERFAGGKALDVGQHVAHLAVAGAPGAAADVGGKNDVVTGEQRVVERDGLVDKDVQPGAGDAMFTQRRDQGRLRRSRRRG